MSAVVEIESKTSSKTNVIPVILGDAIFNSSISVLSKVKPRNRIKTSVHSQTIVQFAFSDERKKKGLFHSMMKAKSNFASSMSFSGIVASESVFKSRASISKSVEGQFHSGNETGQLKDVWQQGIATQLAGMYVGVAAYEAKEAQSEIPGQILVPGTFASHNRTASSVGGETRHYKNEPRRKKPGEIIYIFDRNETLVLTLNNLPYNANQTSMRGAIPYKDGKFTEKLNDDVTLEFSALATVPEVARIENEGRVVTRDMDGNFVEFIIREIEDDYSDDRFKSVTAEGGEFELIDEFLPGYTEANVDFETALEAILEGTRYKLGDVNIPHVEQSVDLKNMTVRKAVHDLIDQWHGEVRYRVEVKNNRIINRYIDVYQERGSDTGKRFVAGKDIESVNRTFDSTEVKTALYGRGESDEDGERLTFSDVEWKKEDGDPVDKPKGQSWVGDPDAMEKWGYMGGRKHKFGFYDGQEKDPADLLLKTWEELQEVNELKDTYEVEVIQLGEILDYPHEKVRLGDKVRVINHEMYPELESQAQVIEYEQDLNNPRQSKVTLGHFRAKLDTDRRATEVQKDHNEKRGEWDKKPKAEAEKVENALKERLDEEFEETAKSIEETEKHIEDAKKELEKAMDNIEVKKDDIEGLDDDLNDLNNSIQDKVPIGHAAEDVNKHNTKILGKNLVVDGDATVTGTIGASDAIFKEVGTRDMYAKNAVIDSGVFTGTFSSPDATIKEATFKNVKITGTLEGVDGTFTGNLEGVDGSFIGTVQAEKIEGNKIEGVTLTTGTENSKYTRIREQTIKLIDNSQPSGPSNKKHKLTIGFENADGASVNEPYIIWGEGKSNGKSIMEMEKTEDHFNMTYSADNGDSSMRFNYSGAVAVTAAGTLLLEASDNIEADTKIYADDFKQNSSKTIKKDIKKLDESGLNVLKDTPVYSFKFKKNDDETKIGFIAEESPKLQDDDKNDGIEFSRAIAFNWKATQEQQELIEDLQKRVEEVEAS